MKCFRVPIPDDLGPMSLMTDQSQVLLEIIESGSGNGRMNVTSQLPVKEWYFYFKF